MPRIDFIGTSCVGKTTLFNRLVQNRRNRLGTGKWWCEWEAREALAREIAKQRGAPHYLTTVLAGILPLIRLRRRLAYHYTYALGAQAFLSMKSEWSDFLNFCVQTSPQVAENPVMYLRSIHGLVEVLEDLAVNQLHAKDRITIWGESISNKAHAVCQWHGLSVNSIKNYFRLSPKPAALIHLRADSSVVMERVRQRQQTTPAYENLVDAQIVNRILEIARVCDYGIQELEKAGVATLTIDAIEPLDVQVMAVEKFIEAQRTRFSQRLKEKAPST